MAIEKIVKLFFEGDGTGLSREMKIVGRDFDNFSQNIQDATGPLGDFGKKVAMTEAALIAIAAGGLVYAFNKAKEFEQATIELNKVMSDGETVTKEMEERFTSLSREYGVSTTSIIGSLAELRQSGFDTSEGMNILNTSLMLSRASELSTEESTNLLKRTLIGYKLEVEDTIKVGDLWNHSSQVSNTNVSKLAEAFAIVSRQSLDAGFSMTETAAALSPIIGVFDSGEEAGVAFSTMLSRILDPAAKGEKAIRLLTGATGPLNDEYKTGKDLFEAVATGLQKVDSQTGLVAVSQIVGVQQAKRIKVAFDDYYKTLDNIGPAANRYNSLQKEVDLQNASAVANVDKLTVAFAELGKEIGQKFRVSATGTISGLTDIQNALQDSLGDETFDVIWDALNSFFSDTEDLLKDVAKNLPEALAGVDFSALVQSFNDLGIEVGDALDTLFGGDLDLSTVEGLEDAIQKIVNMFTGLTNFTAGFIDGLELVLITIGEIAESFGEMDSEGQQMAGNLTGIAETVGVFTGAITSAKNALWAIAGIMGTNLISAPIASIGVAATGSVGAVGAGIMGLAIAFDELYKKALAAVGVDYDSLWDNANSLQGAIQNIIDVATGKKDWWTGELKEGVEGVNTELIKIKDFKPPSDIIINADATIGDDFTFWHDIVKGYEENNPVVKVEVGVSDGKNTIYKWTDSDGNLHFSDTPGNDSNETAISIDVSPTLNEAKAKETIDKTKTYIEEIKVNAETVQSAMEWTAKVDIAQIEADAKVMTSAFESVDNTIMSISGNISDMLGVWTSDNMSFLEKSQTRQVIEKEMEMQEKALNAQLLLLAAQTKYQELKNEKMENGEPQIMIDTTGIEPALEMVMWQIIEKVQLRANENAQEFLKGFT